MPCSVRHNSLMDNKLLLDLKAALHNDLSDDEIFRVLSLPHLTHWIHSICCHFALTDPRFRNEFEQQTLVGEGSFFQVYRAKCKSSGEWFAIKRSKESFRSKNHRCEALHLAANSLFADVPLLFEPQRSVAAGSEAGAAAGRTSQHHHLCSRMARRSTFLRSGQLSHPLIRAIVR